MSDEPVHRERHLLGAYALGQLDPDENDVVEAHLANCPACQEELESLVVTSELLKWYVDKGGDI